MPIDVQILPGLTPFGEGHDLQLAAVEQRKRREIPDTLFLLEHPPVITLGKNADTTGVLASREMLAARGIEMHHIERGGQATYHCPGQIVGYPIVDLHDRRMGVAQYVSNLEEVMIRACASLDVETVRMEGKNGIFATVGHRPKIGALGVRVSRGITFHGFALNVDPDLSGYQLIVPCGLTDTPVSSLAKVAGQAPSMEDVREALIQAFNNVF